MVKRFNEIFDSKKKKVKMQNTELKELRSETKFEKGDILALIIAALTTILPIAAVLLLIFYLISMWLFG